MYVLIFDTETTSLEKPFAYNIGYCILDTDKCAVVKRCDYVVEQVWHNTALFCSAYYTDKRPLYVSRMKARQTIMQKFGVICQNMIRDINRYEIEHAYAYNSGFDERVFNFCCDWFKCINPFDNVAVHDIRGYVHKFVAYTPKYQAYCDLHELFTDSGHYSTTAESVYRYIIDNIFFDEEHTALADSEIETQILLYCMKNEKAEWNMDYKVYQSIKRKVQKCLQVIDTNGEVHEFPYVERTNRNNGDKITLKN